jgi:hypothetical protein
MSQPYGAIEGDVCVGGGKAADVYQLCTSVCTRSPTHILAHTYICRYSDNCTLSTDFLAASLDATLAMNRAAEVFVGALGEAFPGTKVTATTLSRLPHGK